MQKIIIVLLLVALGFAWKPSIEAFYVKMQQKITSEQDDDSRLGGQQKIISKQADDSSLGGRQKITSEQADDSSLDRHQKIISKQVDDSSLDEPSHTAKYKCDGRTYCSQMTSCEEATFFLQNCPGVKMDGNQYFCSYCMQSFQRMLDKMSSTIQKPFSSFTLTRKDNDYEHFERI